VGSGARETADPTFNRKEDPMRYLLLIAAACLLPVAVLAQPRIEVVPDRLDFGDLQEWETRDAEVIIRNTGDQVLRIRQIESTCGCTVPELAVKQLGPGAETVMNVHFNAKTFQGPQHRYLHIYSNDPVRGSFDFLVTADIKVPLFMQPTTTMLRFPTVKAGETESMTYTFSTEDVPRLEITPRDWPAAWLDIEVKPGSSPQIVEVVFAIRPDGPVGRYREPVRLATNVPAVPTVNLEVDVRLVADLILGMERVNLGRVQPGQELSTRVRVTAHDRSLSFRLTGAEIDIPGLRARVENSAAGAFAVIIGEAMASDEPLAVENRGRIQGTLRIFSDLASTPELQVPVTYMLRI
jgi:hypothetical protein